MRTTRTGSRRAARTIALAALVGMLAGVVVVVGGPGPAVAAEPTEPPPTFTLAWGGEGSQAGLFRTPVGIAVAPDGAVYVADTGNHRVQKFDRAGTFVLSFGSQGSADGRFQSPKGIDVDGDGNVYVVDSGNSRVQRFTGTGAFVLSWGSAGSVPGQFAEPHGLAVAPDDTVYVADTGNNRVQRFTGTGSLLTEWGTRGDGDGQFQWAEGLGVGPSGTVYVSDGVTHRVQRFGPYGEYLGQWGTEGSEPGQFANPSGVSVDTWGRVHVADVTNSRIQRFGGGGALRAVWGEDGTDEGQFAGPNAAAVSPVTGEVFVADTYNHRIQRFTPPRPDGRIRRAGTSDLRGDDRYNDTGIGQTVRATVPAGTTAAYVVSYQNDGPGDDTPMIRGPQSTDRFRVRYYLAGSDITGWVKDGCPGGPWLQPGDTWVITMKVTPRTVAPRGTSFTALVTISSGFDRTRVDAVRAVTTRS